MQRMASGVLAYFLAMAMMASSMAVKTLLVDVARTIWVLMAL
jgi:hypothetical protein